jgi:hypothetical protein
VRYVLASLSVICLVAALSSCDQAEKADKKALAAAKSKAPTITCADKATRAELPAGFPAGFPIPAGMVVVGSEKRSDGRLIVYGVSPDGVKTVLADLQKGLPAAGYTPKEGEVEAHDAESNWVGHGYRGRWEIRELPGCDADTSITILAQKQG